MKSRAAQDILGRGLERHTDKANGQGRVGQKFGSHNVLFQMVSVPNKLSEQYNDTELQNDAGAFTFLPGFSAIGGPDVVG